MSDTRRQELIREGEAHPRPDEIAQLLETVPPAGEESALRAHLRVCRRCMALYAELAESDLNARWRAGATAVPNEWLNTAKALAGSAPDSRGPTGMTGRRSRAWTVWLSGAAAAAVIIAFVVLPRWSPPSSVIRSEQLEPIRLAIAEASRSGMVLTPDIAGAAPPTRSGAPDASVLTGALDEFGRMQVGARATEETAYWLAAGMLAENDPGAAVILKEAVTSFPRSTRIANLSAVLDFRETRLADAERRLRGILERRPRDSAALFNLGVLLVDQGRAAELAPLRARMNAAFARGSALRARAESEFGPLSGN